MYCFADEDFQFCFCVILVSDDSAKLKGDRM